MASGKIEFIGVVTHWPALEVSPVPMAQAEISEDTCVIRLPYAIDMIKQAPRHAPHGTLTKEDKAAIYEHLT